MPGRNTGGGEVLALLSLYLGTRWRSVVKFRLLYPCERTPVSTGVEAGWTLNLDVLERKKTARPGYELLSAQHGA